MVQEGEKSGAQGSDQEAYMPVCHILTFLGRQ